MKAKNLDEWRELVLNRDNHTCQKCGEVPNPFRRTILAHHIKPTDEYPKLKLKTENGITLCAKCHKREPVQAKLFQHHKDKWGFLHYYYPRRITNTN